MPVIIAGVAGASWGLSAQSGMIVQASESETSIEENPSRNEDGEECWTAFCNPTRKVEISGIYLGISVLMAQAMPTGAALLFGTTSLNGAIYCTNVRVSGENTGFQHFSMTGKQRNLF